jgi:hypothetical protein
MSLKLKHNITEWPRWKLNFVGIPKCGNTMMKYDLLGQPNVVDLHDSNADLHQEHRARYITPEEANQNDFQTFTIIRNPIDRVKSMWRDFHGKRNGLLGQRDMTFEDFVDKVIVPSDDSENTNVHLRSMHYFIKDIDVIKLVDLAEINYGEGEWLHKILGTDTFESLNTTEELPVDRWGYSYEKNLEIARKIVDRYPKDWNLYMVHINSAKD